MNKGCTELQFFVPDHEHQNSRGETVLTPARTFVLHHEAMDYCRKLKIPLRRIELYFVQRG